MCVCRVTHMCSEHGGGGPPQNLMRGDLSQTWEELRMLSKSTFQGVHLIKKVPAINLQDSKFTKNELLHTSF